MNTPDNDIVVAKYFSAWSSHDYDLVRDIFDETAVYQIEGKRTLNGLPDILAYWERNKRRQRNVKILPALVLPSDGARSVRLFCATFADIEEREQQTVYGRASFDIANGKIKSFTEQYNLLREPSRSPVSAVQYAMMLVKPFYWRLKGWAAQLAEYLLARLSTLLVSLMAIVLGFSAFNIANLPDWLLCNISLAFSECSVLPIRRPELVSIASRNLSTFTAVFVVIAGGLYWLRYQIRTPISLIPLQAENHDLLEMKKRFHTALELTILAGDFSFVGSDGELRDIFHRLNSMRALVLISEKSEERVKAGFGTKPDAITLFEDLKRGGRIHFDTAVPIRCSILRRWHRSEILYRYRGGSNDSFNDLNLCVLKGRKEAGPVLDLIQKLVAKVAS